jgi:glycogen debranching enzyme
MNVQKKTRKSVPIAHGKATAQKTRETNAFAVGLLLALGTEAARPKHDNAFGVFDANGDALSSPGGTEGVYHCDTRHLSHFLITVRSRSPKSRAMCSPPGGPRSASCAGSGRPIGRPAYGAKAEALRARFDALFFDADLGSYVLALDGEKRPCRVRASNAGHALFAGVALPERADPVAEVLMGSSSFCGWGIHDRVG